MPGIQMIKFAAESVKAGGHFMAFLPKPYDAINDVVKTKSDQKSSLLIQ